MKITLVDGSSNHYHDKEFTENLAIGLINAGHKVKLLNAKKNENQLLPGMLELLVENTG
jgi:hypothetical protein